MATNFEVERGHAELADALASAKSEIQSILSRISTVRAKVQGLPSTPRNTDVRTTVQAFAPTGPWQTFQKDLQSKLASDYQALEQIISGIDGAVDSFRGQL